MKPTFIERAISIISPQWAMDRMSARAKSELVLRAYDAAKTFSTDDWTSATKGSANIEIRGAQATLRDKGSDAVRNNPHALSAVDVIVSYTVGTGIRPQIKGKTKLQTKRLVEAWQQWGMTTLCDATGKNNFDTMQSLVMRSTVERGEALAIKEINKKGMQIRLLESDFIASHRDSASVTMARTQNTVQGIKLDENQNVIGYYIYPAHPGEGISTGSEIELSADKVCHIYREDRIGQMRGVSWLHPVIRLLEDLNQYSQATLISKKIAACFSAFITHNDSDSTLSAADLVTKRETENMLTPGSIRYLSRGEGIEFAEPPSSAGYTEFVNQTLHSVAAGMGIPYEALTSDYSQVNYSSARMAYLRFQKNVDNWRWNILIPKFCEPGFKHFLQWCEVVKGIPTDGIQVEWIPPAWAMLDPTKEIPAMTDGIRAGLISYQKAIHELGYEPEAMLQEIADHNARLDEYKLVLDSDPRKITKAGLLQIEPFSNPGQVPPTVPVKGEEEGA